MQTLRRARRLAAFVLAWMVLWLGVAVASPWVQPKNVQAVCSAAGAVKWVVQGDGGAVDLGAASLDCPLCVGSAAPPPAPVAVVTPAAACVSVPSWALLAAHAAPRAHGWQARAPPVVG